MLKAMPGRRSISSSTHGPKHPIRRFPRLPSGEELVALEKLVWNAPRFVAEVRPAEREVDFIFRMSVPKLPKAYRALHSLLFPSNTEYFVNISKSWEEAFQTAFAKARYNNKEFAKFIASPLHELFRTGIQEWLNDEIWNIKGVDGRTLRDSRLPVFKDKSRVRKNQPDPRVALWVSSRRDRLLPAAEHLRNHLKDKASSMTLQELRRRITRLLPYRMFLVGLRRALENPTAGPKDFFNVSGLSTRLVIEAGLGAELENKGIDLRKVSLKKHLEVGEELLNSLAALPKPLS